jgi:hypothetical protein
VNYADVELNNGLPIACCPSRGQLKPQMIDRTKPLAAPSDNRRPCPAACSQPGSSLSEQSFSASNFRPAPPGFELHLCSNKRQFVCPCSANSAPCGQCSRGRTGPGCTSVSRKAAPPPSQSRCHPTRPCPNQTQPKTTTDSTSWLFTTCALPVTGTSLAPAFPSVPIVSPTHPTASPANACRI